MTSRALLASVLIVSFPIALLLYPMASVAEKEQALLVTASAYNSIAGQTNDKPAITAWGDELRPGMRVIAVSRDLIELGLGHGAEVEIDGLPGKYTVRDKMAKRWKHKIDIYMGKDAKAAKEWGVREVTIRWTTP